MGRFITISKDLTPKFVRLLWATLFGYLVFGHLPGVPTWIGASIVIVAAIFTIYREMRRKRGWSPAASGDVGN